MRRTLTAVLVTALLIAGCGGEAGEETTAPPTTAPVTTSPPATAAATTATVAASTTTAATTEASTTTGGVAEVEVVKDLVYHPQTERLGEARLDVYAPVGEEGGPVVVLLHGNAVDKEFSFGETSYPGLARAIAGQGAVVFVPDWGKGQPVTDTTRDGLLDTVDGAACAVSYALAHAAEYGADPGRLVLFGHSGGANVASLVALREATPLPECAVEMTPFEVDGMVLWEGDWLASSAVPWDRYGDDLPLLMEGATPWAWLATGPRMAVDLVTTERSRSEYKRCDLSDPETTYWLRDPDGWFRERLEAIGALADGCIDEGEQTVILADTMREQGFDVVELLLEDSTHTYLSPEDQALVVAEVIAIADR